jgi:hypothetical protein
MAFSIHYGAREECSERVQFHSNGAEVLPYTLNLDFLLVDHLFRLLSLGNQALLSL